MAGIDKMYLSNFDTLVELKRWISAYYPKLYSYMYDWAFNVTKKEFEKKKLEKAKKTQKAYKDDWKRISSDGTINCAVAYIMKEWGWGEKEATEDARLTKKHSQMSVDEIKEDTRLPVLNIPISVDRKLKWICPLPCVRIYLQTHCGVKEHWWYKLFWRGRKEFYYYF